MVNLTNTNLAGAQVAVFIDFENLVIGAEETLPGHTNAVPYEALELLCQEYGNAAVRRAYADWSRPQFGKYQEDLGLNGVDLIQIKRFGTQQKNAADIRMAVDAMETLIVHPEVAVYVLVAGDGDYSPLVQRLREFGKTVVGVGTEASASRRLVSVCSEYKYWATLVASVDPSARAAVAAEFDLESTRPLLVTAVSDSATTPVVAAWLKPRMRTLDPSFDERNYGFKSFGDFLLAMSDTISVVRGEQDLQVTLLETSEAREPEAALMTGDDTIGPDQGLIRILRQRGMDIPPAPETRDALLGSIHAAWSSGAVRTAADIADVLLDDETGFVPNARTRGPLRIAMLRPGTGVLRLAEEPDEHRRLADCRVEPYDGGDQAEWVMRAHAAWLAFALQKITDLPDASQALVDALFVGCREYGEELLAPVIRRPDSRD